MLIEEPEFTLSRIEDIFALRDYAARVVAELTVSGDPQMAGNKCFCRLAIAKSRGLKFISTVSLAQYSQPRTPWFLRRAEVMLPVATT